MTPVDRLKRFFRVWKGGSIQDPIFFLHVPKCGGSSVTRALEESIGLRKWITGKYHYLKAAPSRKAADDMGLGLMDYRNHILSYHMNDETMMYIGGHFGFSRRLYERHSDRWKYVTILRNPMKKWFSQYFYNRYKEDDHFSLEGGIEEFAHSETGHHLGSDFVHKLTDGIPAEDCDSDAAVERALDNIDKFDLVGVIEEIGAFTAGFEQIFGFKLDIPHVNRSPVNKQKRKEMITDEVRARVESYCEPDLRIYNYVLDQQIRDDA
jgi:hypothetical protein